jgi:hypothetical protein
MYAHFQESGLFTHNANPTFKAVIAATSSRVYVLLSTPFAI